MSQPVSRVQLTVRLNADDKAFFAEEATRCGLEPGVAARQILELYVQRMRDGGDFIDALHALKCAMRQQEQAA